MKTTALAVVLATALALVSLPASAQQMLLFCDDFEQGTNNWVTFTGCTSLQYVTTATDPNCNHTPGGSAGLKFSANLDRIYADFTPGLYASTVTCSVWLYDDGTAGNTTIYDLRDLTTYRQVLGIGKNATMAGNSSVYQCRVLTAANGTSGVGWVNMSIARSTGWHEFTIIQHRDTDSVDFLVDGILGYQSTDVLDIALAKLVMGTGFGSTATTGYADDASLTAIPEPSSILALLTGLASCVAVVSRRRRS